MVQDLDERVYWNDAGVVNATKPRSETALLLYSNTTTNIIDVINQTE